MCLALAFAKEDIAAVKTAVNVPGKTDVPTLSEEAISQLLVQA